MQILICVHSEILFSALLQAFEGESCEIPAPAHRTMNAISRVLTSILSSKQFSHEIIPHIASLNSVRGTSIAQFNHAFSGSTINPDWTEQCVPDLV